MRMRIARDRTRAYSFTSPFPLICPPSESVPLPDSSSVAITQTSRITVRSLRTRTSSKFRLTAAVSCQCGQQHEQHDLLPSLRPFFTSRSLRWSHLSLTVCSFARSTSTSFFSYSCSRVLSRVQVALHCEGPSSSRAIGCMWLPVATAQPPPTSPHSRRFLAPSDAICSIAAHMRIDCVPS
jgi:hypothetical protein